MSRGPTRPAPSIKIDGAWRPRGKGPHDDREVRMAYALCHTPTLTKLLSGVDFTELRVTKLAEVYRVMVKGKRGKRYLVSFFYGGTIVEALMSALTHLDTGYAHWKDDAYPPKT